MNKTTEQILKTVLVSSLVSTNILIWHNLLGAKFLLAIVVLGLIVVLTSKTEDA